VDIPLYLALGAFAGTLAGLLGVGGGLVMVPVLVFIFQGQAMHGAVIMHMALGTSLAIIMLTSLSSIRAHHQRGAVLWSLCGRLVPGIVLGALSGAVVADMLSDAVLKPVFGIFELLVALQMWLGVRPSMQRNVPDWLGMGVVGWVIGSVSAIVGIGGGTLTVPFLAWCRIGIHNAVATSAACGFPIAVAGTLGFIATGWNEAGLPAMSSGYVYWPAFAAVGVASMLFAPLGARLAHALPADKLKKFFAIFLAVLGVRMLMA
jgi:uncharacterized membrane protein YfcA